MVKVKKVGSRVHLVNPDGSHGDRIDLQATLKQLASKKKHGQVWNLKASDLTKVLSVQDKHIKGLAKKKKRR